MKRILITGANSYIGTSFENYIKQFEDYSVDTIDMIDGSWRDYDFSEYNVVFHVAGIAHIKETEKNKQLYYDVNRDLAVETAEKAKNSGVKQFVLLSSMSVYGITIGVITKDTIPMPKSNYGKSKLEADNIIETLSDKNFKVAILRPPMVYGEGCKGNYQLLRKFALKSPVFPNIRNQRSMVHIDGLCKFVKWVMDSEVGGYYFPQDNDYVCTSQMVKKIAQEYGKKIRLVKIFNPLIILFKNTNLISKVFGDLICDIEEGAYNSE